MIRRLTAASLSASVGRTRADRQEEATEPTIAEASPTANAMISGGAVI
jgi:hypothetical protein